MTGYVFLAAICGFVGGVVFSYFAARRFLRWLNSPAGTEYATKKYLETVDGKK